MESIDPSQYLAEIIYGVLDSIKPNGGILGTLTKEATLELIGSYGYAEIDIKGFHNVSMNENLPITLCIKEKRIIAHKSKEEFRKAYPHLKDFQSIKNSEVTTFAVPLIYRLSAIGAIGFTAEECPKDIFDDYNFWSGFGSICSFYVVQRLQSKVLNGQVIATADLTERQIEILIRFKDGLTIENIADQLNFSDSTIRQEIMRIYKKLGVKDRKSALNVAIEKQII
jgi:DNA-binding CsgD family transcriptional regulator